MRIILCGVILAVALAGCDRRDTGTAVSINAGDAAGSFDAADGEVKIDTPVFQGTFKLPKVDMTADNFDINGVHLYPGSRIGAVNVDAQGARGGDGMVTVRFNSPANVATVRDWLRREFEKAGTSVAVEGNAIRGRTDRKPFRIELSPDGARAAGTVTIG